ncbi:MAG: hypothetical protein MR654_06920 [Corynebacterium glucuronolyticum]|nr:hypothetical protein [Corynebacterium glucuronolyticum]
MGDSLHVSAISGDEVDLTLTVTGIVKGAGAAVLKDSVPPLTGEQVWWETPIPAQRFLVMDGSASMDLLPWIMLMLVLAVALTAPVLSSSDTPWILLPLKAHSRGSCEASLSSRVLSALPLDASLAPC